MKNFVEDLGITGHLQIVKKMSSGQEEVLLDDHNIIVSGMGVGLSYLFAASGSDSILDYQVECFQLGISGPPAGGVTSAIYELSGPIADSEYGAASNLFIAERDQITGATRTLNQAFAIIPAGKITRIADNSVRYTLVVDEQACNSIIRDSESRALNEIGLFMKNPTGAADPEPILVAYRTFSDIIKTDDFSLIFRWTLNF